MLAAAASDGVEEIVIFANTTQSCIRMIEIEDSAVFSFRHDNTPRLDVDVPVRADDS
jgi:hypothetical protein